MWQFGVLLGSLLLPNTAASTVSTSVGELAIRDGKTYSCKCYPGDACYPKASKWNALNVTVQGNLQVALPPAAPCYPFVNGIPTGDAAKCDEVRQNYTDEQWATDHPIANLWTFWTNETCQPDPASTTCTSGFYGNYVILAKKKEHVKAGVDFVRENNLRLVIRNTGHDFLGRSTGWGSMIINTHSFKSVSFTTKYKGPGKYRGGAVTVGAGIQGRELLRLANAQKPPVVLVTGECPTVGFAGGYIQGGGHGPLASYFGLAADQALSFDVITASGKYVTANEAENPDLFWALKGGGPSTFGTVISLTVKTFPEMPTAGIIFDDFLATDPVLFWKAVAALHDLANYWVENGMFIYYELGFGRLHIRPMVGPNMNAAKINAVAKPMFDALKAAGVPYNATTKEFPTFFDMYIALFEDEAAGTSALSGGRFFTEDDINQHAAAIVDAYKTGLENNFFFIGHIVGPRFGAPVADNAIHPRWRNASSFSISSTPISGSAPLVEKARVQNILTNVVGKALREAAPNGGAYVNEGDLEEPNWQNEYWGSNYPRLYKLKQKWDPQGVFYARTTPGTEDWESIDGNTRLCKKL